MSFPKPREVLAASALRAENKRSKADMNILKTKRSKIIFVVTVLAACVVAIAAAFIIRAVFNPSTSSATKVGYVGKETKAEWSASYSYLDGRLEKKFSPSGDRTVLLLEFATEEGELDYAVFDKNGEASYSDGEFFENVGNGRWVVEIDEEVTVRLDAREHKGRFSITLEKPEDVND